MSEAEVMVTSPVPAYAKLCGILALIFAIVGVMIPVVGVLFVTPLAIVLGAVALYGASKGLGIATLIIVVVNLLISPSFWLNIGAGATNANASANRFLTYVDVLGVAAMLYLAVRRPRTAGRRDASGAGRPTAAP